jgi:hypothetical protein
MVTIFKNFSTTLVAIGDFAFFGQELTTGIITSVVIMVDRLDSISNDK